MSLSWDLIQVFRERYTHEHLKTNLWSGSKRTDYQRSPASSCLSTTTRTGFAWDPGQFSFGFVRIQHLHHFDAGIFPETYQKYCKKTG